jgi:hypothetical protein
MKATWRQLSAPSMPVLSKDMPRRFRPSWGTPFHSLQATSQALHPMQTDVSVKNPLRGGASTCPASGAGSSGPKKLLRLTTSGTSCPYERPSSERAVTIGTWWSSATPDRRW